MLNLVNGNSYRNNIFINELVNFQIVLCTFVWVHPKLSFGAGATMCIKLFFKYIKISAFLLKK